MKKFIFSGLMLILSWPIWAQQQVPAPWAFNIANIQGSYFRATLDEANQQQKKYQFVAESRPGAGGNIAASYVLAQDRLAVLGTAAAFFVRPNLYTTTTGYRFEDYRPVHVMALSPAALVTGKGKTLADILKKDRITIGTAGAGSLTHLMALKFAEEVPGKKFEVIPYKSSTEALADVLGNHIDLTFEFLGDAEAKSANIIGVTGTTKIKSYPLLKDMGYPTQAGMVGVYLILVKNSTSDATVAELRNIFLAAEKNAKVQELYSSDYSSKPANLKTEADYQRWYKDTIQFFRSVTAGQKID
jgi:tripartite-type tricarboxylate transporter receptor subunit TctC